MDIEKLEALRAKLENMDDEERMEFMQEMSQNNQKTMIVDILSKGILDMLSDYDTQIIQSVIMSVFINFALNESICPYCFKRRLKIAIKDMFDLSETKDGVHTFKIKDADKLAEHMRDGASLQ